MNQQVDIDAAANFREYELTLTVDPGASASVAVAVCRKKELAKAFAAHRLAAEKAERERIVAWLSEVQPNLHDTTAMLREVARERDRLNVWCSKEYSEGAMEQWCEDETFLRKAAEAEAAALREALRKAHDALAPAVGDVEIVSPIAKPIYRAFGILIDALKETSDGL